MSTIATMSGVKAIARSLTCARSTSGSSTVSRSLTALSMVVSSLLLLSTGTTAESPAAAAAWPSPPVASPVPLSPLPPPPPPPAPPSCASPIDVATRSFQALSSPARLAYVWVGDIKSRIFGGFDPFEIYVVTGQAYAPFQANSGVLDRAAFLKLTDNYNARRYGPLRVTPDSRASGRLNFEAGRSKFYLTVARVQAPSLGRGAAAVQFCW